MASTLKKVVIALGAIVLAGILLLAALIAVVTLGDNKARARAMALCNPALIGVSSADALERARKSQPANVELRWHDVGDGRDTLLVAFPAALPLTGYLCSISARGGIVTATDITTVD